MAEEEALSLSNAISLGLAPQSTHNIIIILAGNGRGNIQGTDVSAGKALARSLSEMKFKQGTPAGSMWEVVKHTLSLSLSTDDTKSFILPK